MKIFQLWKSSRRLKKLCFPGILVFCIISLLVFIQLIDRNQTFELENAAESVEEIVIIDTQPNVEEKEEIVILRYTKYFGHPEVTPLLTSNDCPYVITESSHQNVFNLPCRITFDRKYFKSSDALVFHSYDLEREELPRGPRDENQIWVYLQQESPPNTGLNLGLYPNTFNWTMTYRRDSDVHHPYGLILPRSSLPNSEGSTNIQTNKSRLVAWIVSNCDAPSLRQNLVYQLQKYIQVDVFGSCGRPCPSKPADCYHFVASNYKFYLAFENSLCSDYITEKLFKPMMHGLLPVVFGGGVESTDYSSIAPIHSYIDARTFKSPESLAAYLIHLDNNPEEYQKYFEWRKHYQVVIPRAGYWCNLCQRIYEHFIKLRNGEQKRKWYKDLKKWWNQKESHIDDNTYNKSIPACAVPPKTLTAFNPGFLRTGWLGKVLRWAFKIDFWNKNKQ